MSSLLDGRELGWMREGGRHPPRGEGGLIARAFCLQALSTWVDDGWGDVTSP